MTKKIELLAFVLVIVGAVNWGLVGLAQFDLVAFLFGGQAAPLSRIVYTAVGAAAIVLVAMKPFGAPALPSSGTLGHASEPRRQM